MKLSIKKEKEESTEVLRGHIKHFFYPKDGLDESKLIQRAGFILKSGRKSYQCFGMIGIVQEGEYVELQNVIIHNDGKVNFAQAIRVDNDEAGALSMLQFLFGPKTMVRIISSFGMPAVQVINLFKNDRDTFEITARGVKGIGPKKLESAYRKYENNIAVDVIFSKFGRFGVSINKALKIYSLWGAKSLDVLQENPYRLLDVDGIPFAVMDKIALGFYHLEKDDKRRIEGEIIQQIRLAGSEGSCFAFKDMLIEGACQTLGVDQALVVESLLVLESAGRVIAANYKGEQVLYLPSVFRSEMDVSQRIINLISHKKVSEAQSKKVNEYIASYESTHFKLAQRQADAIRNSLQNSFSIISGPPGSGKTTIIDAIVKYYKARGKKIKMCAPTGKASKRMTESTEMPASTIHRLLEYQPQDGKFLYDENNKLDVDVLIVDEFSMVGIWLASQLLKAIPDSISSVVFVGDKNQLPSVDAGKVLEDILDVKKIPQVILTDVYRQGKNSSIFTRAVDYQNGEMPSLEDDAEFKFYPESDVDIIKEGVVALYGDEIKKWGADDVAILCPQNIGPIGIDAFNELIQATYNPKKFDKTPEMKSGHRVFRIGDRVVQLKNEDSENVYNGMVGTITDIQNADKEYELEDIITVDFGDDVVSDYTRDRFDNIKLAYATTVHKSQGSEYKSVILICHSANRFMLRKKLVYTGMTRAKKELHIVGEASAIRNSLQNTSETKRNTRLSQLLKEGLSRLE